MKWTVFSQIAILAAIVSGACFAQETTRAANDGIGAAGTVKSVSTSSALKQEKKQEAPTKPYMNMEMAQKVLDGAIAYAKEVEAPGGSIAIVDDGGHLILLHRMDGTMPATPPIATGKARTAALFRMPTLKFEDITRGGRVSMLKIEGFMPMQGGIPIKIDGHVIGAIGVSGASSAPQDEEIAIAGADVYNKMEKDAAKENSSEKESSR